MADLNQPMIEEENHPLIHNPLGRLWMTPTATAEITPR